MIILCPPKKSVQLMLAEERRIFLAKNSKCFCQRKCSISVSNLRSSSFLRNLPTKYSMLVAKTATVGKLLLSFEKVICSLILQFRKIDE